MRVSALLHSPDNQQGWRAADSTSLRDCWEKQEPENRFWTPTNTTTLLRTIHLGKEKGMLSIGTRRSAVPITHIWEYYMQRFHCKLYGITSYLFVATQKSCKKPWLGEKLFLLILSEVLSPRTNQLRQAHKPGDILTQAVKQPYSKCCLTRCVQRNTVGAMWTIWRWCQETSVDPTALSTQVFV